MRTKQWRGVLALAVAGVAANQILFAASNDVTSLQQRLDKLAAEMDQIKGALAEKGVSLPAKGTPGKPVTSSLDVRLYGYVKLDAAFDDSRVNIGDYARWVESEGVLDDDHHFNMTANQTRLGALVEGPQAKGWRTSGQVEMDFYGDMGTGATENKPGVLVRHTFLKAEQPEWNFSLLAGQTSDIISPLVAPTINYTVLWWQGNIGYRRPQIRLAKGFTLADGVEFKLEGGPTRTITDRRFGYTGPVDPDSGADAGFPTTQGRASLTFPSLNKKPATIGLSGHWGEEEQHLLSTNNAVIGDATFDSWSANVDARLPVTDWLLLQGEAFVGENLGAYLGGIGQGFDAVRTNSVAAKGGWVAATLGPWANWQFNLGAGIDTVDRDDVTVNAKAPPRSANHVFFGNASYALTANLQLAFELSRLRTTYKGAAAGDDWREQVAMTYKF
jgi:hypothetical protein